MIKIIIVIEKVINNNSNKKIINNNSNDKNYDNNDKTTIIIMIIVRIVILMIPSNNLGSHWITRKPLQRPAEHVPQRGIRATDGADGTRTGRAERCKQHFAPSAPEPS